MSKGEKKRRRALDAYGALQRVAALSATHVDVATHAFGLSASQFGVLETLQQRGPVHQQELAEALARSKAQMTAIIDALEGRGLVRRERHAVDRRFITVYLTEAGHVLLADVGPVRTEAIVGLMRELSGEQKTRLTRLCRRLIRMLDPGSDDGTDHDQEGDAAESLLDDDDSDAPGSPASTAETEHVA